MSLEDTSHIGLQAMSYFNKQKPEPEAPQRFSLFPQIPESMMQLLQHIHSINTEYVLMICLVLCIEKCQ